MAARKSGREEFVGDWMGDGGAQEGRFNPLVIDGRRPIEAAWKVGGWIVVGIPLLTSLVWGVYDSNNLMGVLGISGRRAFGSAINDTRPIGESLLNGASGGKFVPGEGNRSQKNLDSLRPGATSEPSSAETSEANGVVTGQ